MKILLIIVSVFFCGCASKQPMPNDPYYAPVMMQNIPARPPQGGSLFSDDSAVSLFTDDRAAKVGDIITVVLSEQTVSNKSANVGVTKDSELNLPAPTIFGGAITFRDRTLENSMNNERDFSGQADAAQSNSLRGNISVTVTDVWPNGTLVIRGEKWLTLNRGDELIRISGLVRPEDISLNNEVQSTKIANAKIMYTGTGELASSQKMGFLSRFFNSDYWPF